MFAQPAFNIQCALQQCLALMWVLSLSVLARRQGVTGCGLGAGSGVRIAAVPAGPARPTPRWVDSATSCSINGPPTSPAGRASGRSSASISSTLPTRGIFNVALPGAARNWSAVTAAEYERETFVNEVLLAPSERVVLDVRFDTARAGSARAPHPSITSTSSAASTSRPRPPTRPGRRWCRRLVPCAARRSRLTAEHRSIAYDVGRPPGQGARVLLAHAAALRPRRHLRHRLRLPDAPAGHRRRAGCRRSRNAAGS